MKALVFAFAALIAMPAAAYADGWFGGCDDDHDGTSDGCDSDSEANLCKCSSSSNPASVGVGLGLTGLVAWRIGRKRRPR